MIVQERLVVLGLLVVALVVQDLDHQTKLMVLIVPSQQDEVLLF
jgi:hypothetical protein